MFHPPLRWSHNLPQNFPRTSRAPPVSFEAAKSRTLVSSMTAGSTDGQTDCFVETYWYRVFTLQRRRRNRSSAGTSSKRAISPWGTTVHDRPVAGFQQELTSRRVPSIGVALSAGWAFRTRKRGQSLGDGGSRRSPGARTRRPLMASTGVIYNCHIHHCDKGNSESENSTHATKSIKNK